MSAKDALGDRCKQFESAEAGRRAMPGIPLLARLDGRAFHTFTRGLNRPFDERFGHCMLETARTLVEDLGALVAYTQSDEITLLWWVPSAGPKAYPFDGRFQKLASISAGIASAAFARLVVQHLPEKAKALPAFDARVWQVPTREDAIDVLIWREGDATRNSLEMVSRAHYTHKELHQKGGRDMHEMLHAKGVNWSDFPARFKRGAYVRRETVAREFSAEHLARIPERHRPAPGTRVERSEVRVVDMPPIRRVANPVETLFEGAPPVER